MIRLKIETNNYRFRIKNYLKLVLTWKLLVYSENYLFACQILHNGNTDLSSSSQPIQTVMQAIIQVYYDFQQEEILCENLYRDTISNANSWCIKNAWPTVSILYLNVEEYLIYEIIRKAWGVNC